MSTLEHPSPQVKPQGLPPPYYEDEATTIYHGDSRVILPSLAAAPRLLITSPPYNAGKDYGVYDDAQDLAAYWWLVEDVIAKALAVCHAGAWAAWNVPMWAGSRPSGFMPFEWLTRLQALGWEFKDWITWVKGSSDSPEANSTAWGHFPTTPVMRSASEVILIVRGPGYVSRTIPDIDWPSWAKWTVGVWNMQGVSQNGHPAAFPLALPKRLIRLYSLPGDVVLDPFMGSGTTLRAAKDLGRRAIGIEIEERFCELAANRLRQMVLV